VEEEVSPHLKVILKNKDRDVDHDDHAKNWHQDPQTEEHAKMVQQRRHHTQRIRELTPVRRVLELIERKERGGEEGTEPRGDSSRD
jgi:hypothetical protein